MQSGTGHVHAQIAAHAFVFLHSKWRLPSLVGSDGLVAGVLAGDVAAPALDAQVLVIWALTVWFRFRYCQSVTLGTALPTISPRCSPCYRGSWTGHRHVLHDLEAVDHGRGADLHIARAQAMKSSASRQVPMPPMPLIGRPARGRVAGDLGHHVQRNGFHRRAAVAAMLPMPPVAGVMVSVSGSTPMMELMVLMGSPHRHRRAWRPGRQADVGDVGRELHDDRQAAVLLAPGGDHLDVLGHLAHSRAHAALSCRADNRS